MQPSNTPIHTVSAGKASLWEVTSPQLAFPTSQLNAARRYDVAIIGAGFTGISAALHLADRGVDCAVLEAHDLGHGGSGRNVGLVNAGLWLPPEDVKARIGNDAGERLNRCLGDGPSLVFSLIEQYNIECEALRNGTLHLAHSTQGLRDLERRYRQLSDLGAPVQLLQHADSENLTGSRYYQAALQDKRAGTIQPLAYLRGLAAAAQAAGAHIYSHTPALSIERAGQYWRIKSDKGEVSSEQVIIATNAYSQSLWPDMAKSLIPVHYFQLATEPLDDAFNTTILPGRHGCWDTQKIMMSMRKDAQGRLIFGSIGPTSPGADSAMQQWCERMRKRLFPQLGPQRWRYNWHGRIAFTPDHIPRMHQLAPGIMTCLAYNGRGIAPGTLSGKAMAELILGASLKDFPLPVAPLKPLRFNKFRAALTDFAVRSLHQLQGRY